MPSGMYRLFMKGPYALPHNVPDEGPAAEAYAAQLVARITRELQHETFFEMSPEEAAESIKMERLENIFNSFFSAIAGPPPSLDDVKVIRQKNSEPVYFEFDTVTWKGKFQTKSFSIKGNRYFELKFIIPNDGFVFTSPENNALTVRGTVHDRHKKYGAPTTWELLDFFEVNKKLPSIVSFAKKWFLPERPICSIWYSVNSQALDIEFLSNNVFLTIQFELGFPMRPFSMEWMQNIE
jgi:hypothetical protein